MMEQCTVGSKLVAEFQPQIPPSGKYYYYLSDQINSTRMVTDDAGAVVYSATYDPFGGTQKVWTNAYDPKLKFSGKEREQQSELDYFGARYYDHLAYRFNSVDPVINKDEALSNPQLWNLYAYCRNNPISFFDPDGRWTEMIHDLIIIGALEGSLSKSEISIMIDANNKFDKNQQDKQWKHALLEEGHATPKDLEYSLKQRESFKKRGIELIRTSRAERNKKGDNRAWSENELKILGMIQHPYADEFCSSHGWKEYKGLSYQHIKGDEDFSDKKNIDKSISIVKRIFEEASK